MARLRAGGRARQIKVSQGGRRDSWAGGSGDGSGSGYGYGYGCMDVYMYMGMGMGMGDWGVRAAPRAK